MPVCSAEAVMLILVLLANGLACLSTSTVLASLSSTSSNLFSMGKVEEGRDERIRTQKHVRNLNHSKASTSVQEEIRARKGKRQREHYTRAAAVATGDVEEHKICSFLQKLQNLCGEPSVVEAYESYQNLCVRPGPPGDKYEVRARVNDPERFKSNREEHRSRSSFRATEGRTGTQAQNQMLRQSHAQTQTRTQTRGQKRTRRRTEAWHTATKRSLCDMVDVIKEAARGELIETENLEAADFQSNFETYVNICPDRESNAENIRITLEELEEQQALYCSSLKEPGFKSSSLFFYTDSIAGDIKYAIVGKPCHLEFSFTTAVPLRLGTKIILGLPGFSAGSDEKMDAGKSLDGEVVEGTCGDTEWGDAVFKETNGTPTLTFRMLGNSSGGELFPSETPCTFSVPTGLTTPLAHTEANNPTFTVETVAMSVVGDPESGGLGARPIAFSNALCASEDDPSCCNATNCTACDGKQYCTGLPGGGCAWTSPDASGKVYTCMSVACSSTNCSACETESTCTSPCQWSEGSNGSLSTCVIGGGGADNLDLSTTQNPENESGTNGSDGESGVDL